MMEYTDKYWKMVIPYVKKSVTKRYGKEYTTALMKKTYTEYKDMMCRIDDVGKDNSMASNIYECLVFSVSENAENMTEQMVSEMEGLATLTADLTELANKLSDNLEKFLA